MNPRNSSKTTLNKLDILFHGTRRTIWAALIFFLSVLAIALPPSHAAPPKYYKENKVFYDSLSIVLNKYIVPVGYRDLLEGLTDEQAAIKKCFNGLKREI
jgi:small-conductance mechanosensitive channel